VTFLGEVAESRVDRLAMAVGAAVAAGRPTRLRLRLRGAGTFPARGTPRVLWVGVADAAPVTPGEAGGAGDLAVLGRAARAVGRGARAAGATVERRPFHPHLTLGRWRPADPADRAVSDALAGYAGPPFDVTELVLMRSHLGPDPRYDRLLSWPLPPAG
jgi:2'-5' RNA ligase